MFPGCPSLLPASCFQSAPSLRSSRISAILHRSWSWHHLALPQWCLAAIGNVLQTWILGVVELACLLWAISGEQVLGTWKHIIHGPEQDSKLYSQAVSLPLCCWLWFYSTHLYNFRNHQSFPYFEALDHISWSCSKSKTSLLAAVILVFDVWLRDLLSSLYSIACYTNLGLGCFAEIGEVNLSAQTRTLIFSPSTEKEMLLLLTPFGLREWRTWLVTNINICRYIYIFWTCW